MSYDVSIIVPVHNSADYIDDTLNSIINQNFKNYELVIVNDGSTDNTIEIIESILNDSKISYKLINQKNKGVSSARNKGIENSNGEYIVFVDDDDLISNNHISCLFENAQNHDGSFTKMLKINDYGEFIENESIYNIIDNKSEISSKDLIKLELKMQIPFSFCQIMYKKELIHEMFNINSIYGEDTEFALKNLIHMGSLGICPDATYFYRQRNDSTTKKVDFKRFEFINILEELSKYYDDNNHKDLAELVVRNRIPKAIFGNLMYFFYYNYDFSQTISKMEELNLFNKLKKFKGEAKFNFKIKLFLFSPKLYYKSWKTFKDDI